MKQRMSIIPKQSQHSHTIRRSMSRMPRLFSQERRTICRDDGKGLRAINLQNQEELPRNILKGNPTKQFQPNSICASFRQKIRGKPLCINQRFNKKVSTICIKTNKHVLINLNQSGSKDISHTNEIATNTNRNVRYVVVQTVKYICHQRKNTGLNPKTLQQRKESHLNAYYNVRKNKLKEITKVNKKIYVRINSQKSLYSNTDLNKSYESNCSMSRRLSQSKLSKKSQDSHICRPKNKKQPLIIQSQSINQLQTKDLNKYANIFQRKTLQNRENINIPTKKLAKIVQEIGSGIPFFKRQ